MLTDLKLYCWSRPGIPNLLLYRLQPRGLYLSQLKCMMAVSVGMSVGIWFLYRRATAPKVSPLWKDQRQTLYIAATTTAVFRFCCGRLGTALTPVSSLMTLTGLTFCLVVHAALIVPPSFKSEGGVLLHSWFPMKFTMSTSPPLTIGVIRRWAATSSFFQGSAGWCLDFVHLAFWSSGFQSDNGSDHLLSTLTVPASPVLSHWWCYPSHHCPRNAHVDQISGFCSESLRLHGCLHFNTISE